MNLSVLKDLKYAKKFLQSTLIVPSAFPALYIVLSGEAGEYTNYRKQLQKLEHKYGPGDFFGESELLLSRKIKTDILAITDVIALVITEAQAVDFIQDEPALAYELMKALCERGLIANAVHFPKKEHEKSQPTAAPVIDKSAATFAPPPPDALIAPPPKPHIQQATVKSVAAVSTTSLFPEGHKTYQLPMSNQNHEYLLQKKYTCPLCNQEFTVLHIRDTKLVHLSVDRDMRTRYKDIEPLYYNVVTCPACHYSALQDMFCHPDKPGTPSLPKGFSALAADIPFGVEMNTDSVFAGYYLALLCAPHCFMKYQTAEAKLLYKLQQIYQDAGDAEMEKMTAQKALDAYSYVYLNMDIAGSQDQQICILLGELSLKLGNFKGAKENFFKAKMNKKGTPLMQRHADDRIFDIREMEASKNENKP